MNRKSLFLTLLLSLVLIGLAGARLTSEAPSIDDATHAVANGQAVEVTLSFKVRLRLPNFKKDQI